MPQNQNTLIMQLLNRDQARQDQARAEQLFAQQQMQQGLDKGLDAASRGGDIRRANEARSEQMAGARGGLEQTLGLEPSVYEAEGETAAAELGGLGAMAGQEQARARSLEERALQQLKQRGEMAKARLGYTEAVDVADIRGGYGVEKAKIGADAWRQRQIGDPRVDIAGQESRRRWVADEADVLIAQARGAMAQGDLRGAAKAYQTAAALYADNNLAAPPSLQAESQRILGINPATPAPRPPEEPASDEDEWDAMIPPPVPPR